MFNEYRLDKIIFYLKIIGLVFYFKIKDIIYPAMEHSNAPLHITTEGNVNLAGGILGSEEIY